MATLYYTNEQDVRDKLLSDPGTSVVSDALIEEWLEAFEAEVDAILTAQGYGTVPVTGTRDVKMIGDKVSCAGAARVYRKAFPGKDEPAYVTAFWKSWTDFLYALRKGELQLISETPSSAAEGQMVWDVHDLGIDYESS